MQECTLELQPGGLAARVPLPLDPRADFPVRVGISLRRAGDMGRLASDPREFAPAREAFLRGQGLSGCRVFACRQVHSRRVLAVGARDPQELSLVNADGLLSDRPAVLLTATVADCLPIFLADPGRGVIGLLHSGWRGTGIVEQAVRRMGRFYGCRPADIAVSIGPGIGPCCYQVDGRRAEGYRRRFGEAAVSLRAGRAYLDLRAANLSLLEGLGVQQVLVVRECTACSPLLASYRRDGAAFVRMLAFIGAAGAGA